MQGVGYRATARAIASRHPVTGWVRNEPDGDVLLEVQGGVDAIDRFLDDLHAHGAGHVVRHHTLPVPTLDGETGFTIRH